MNNKIHKNSLLIKKFLKDFLINEKSSILICFLLLLIVSLTTSIYPYLIKKVFDNFSPKILNNKNRKIIKIDCRKYLINFIYFSL